ncbi:MAG TPA: hypothetical protein VG899_12365 [Mycobacteriales bacterium]|nr:hypothetical protein [Mycobacteriales bacterium]
MNTTAARRRARLTTDIGRYTRRACRCGRPIRDAYLCRECTGTLAALLEQVPQLAADAAIAYSKRSRMAAKVGAARSAETSLPYDPRPRRASDRLAKVLYRYAVTFSGLLLPAGRPAGPTHPRCQHTSCTAIRGQLSTDPLDLAKQLHDRRHKIRRQPAAPNLLADLQRATERLSDLIDRHEHWYAGPCLEPYVYLDENNEIRLQCTAELYARDDATEITCPTCGAIHNLEARQRWLMKESEEVLATTLEICRAVETYTGTALTQERLRQWRHRDKLHARACRLDDQTNLYRLGDVLDLLHAARRAAIPDQREDLDAWNLGPDHHCSKPSKPHGVALCPVCDDPVNINGLAIVMTHGTCDGAGITARPLRVTPACRIA